MDDIAASWQPESVHERVRRFAGEWLYEEWSEIENPESPFSEQLGRLAEDLISDPDLLRDEVMWLLTPEADHALDLGIILGRRDHEHKLANIIVDNLKEGSNPYLPTGYFAGTYEVDENLACTMVEGQMGAPIGAEIVARLVRLAVNPKIVEMLIDAIRSGLVTESGWLSLKLGTWHTSMQMLSIAI